MRRSSFLKHIKAMDEEELREELIKLFDQSKEVKLYYKMDLGDDKERKKVFDAAKKEIAKKYVTKSYRRPRRPRIQKVNKLLSELNKSALLSYEMIDVYLFTAETAINFNHEYGFFSEVLMRNISNCFEKAIHLIIDNRMEDDYKERAEAIMQMLPFDLGLRRKMKENFAKAYK